MDLNKRKGGQALVMHSMTGFGRSESLTPGRRVTVEIRSINNRYCDIQIRMPLSMGPLESQIRQVVASRLSRGKIDVFIKYEETRADSSEVRYDLALARSYAQALREIATTIDGEHRVSAAVIARFPDVLRVETTALDHDALWVQIEPTLTAALDSLIAMRATEGAKLAADILDKVASLQDAHQQICDRAPHVPEAYRQRLDARLTELLGAQKDEIMDPARLAGEVALFADKCAVDEELVRLQSHLAQLRDAVRTGGVQGKKMDFIMQEINREINTIGAKANDIEITNLVIGMKAALEKIREQTQNIE